MSKKFDLYKCNICGKIAEIVLDGSGSLICCNENMKLLENKSTDSMFEKHVPSIEHLGTSHVVKIGLIPHPMADEHYIQFIEIISKDGRYLKRKYLNPDEEPEMIVKCLNEDDFSAREYCNIHGLYTEENNGK